MAHFAKISEQNEVLAVLTLNDSDMLNDQGVETESVGQQYLEKNNHWPAHLWIQTSYNTHQNIYYLHDENGYRYEDPDQSKAFRGNYAGMGYTLDSENQIFWPQKPYTSWVKDTATATWKSPLGDPPPFTPEQQAQWDSGERAWTYVWDESAYESDPTTGWILTDLSG